MGSFSPNCVVITIGDRSGVNKIELGSILGTEETMTVEWSDPVANHFAEEVWMGWMDCLHQCDGTGFSNTKG